MAKYKLNREQLKEHINAVLSEAIDAYGMSSDYMNDMNSLANTTGETMDDSFLDSVAQYDGRNGDGGPVYPDRKSEEMASDWRGVDDQAADTQAQYGKDADALDRLEAFTDTIDQYINDTNLNGYEDNSGYMAMKDYDNARAEAEHPVESVIRRAVMEALKEDAYNHPEQSNGNQFASNHGIDAHKFTHNGVDAYHARKDQDKMHKSEKQKMKRADKRWQKAADSRPLHRKGSLNRAFIESKIMDITKKVIREMTDDDAFWKQQQQDELNYDMKELTKAMQQAHGTYHAKSSDGQWQTGDKVIVHGRKKDITGIIKDFGQHLMTWEETCDVDFEENGQMKTLIGVPLSKIERLNESEKKTNKRLNEVWYPEEDDDLSDYSYGAIMKLNVDGMFDELAPEKVQELQNAKDEYIDNSDKYSSVLVRKIILEPDGFDGYDVSVEVAVSSPDMPMDAIEDEVESMVWYYIEEKTGVRSPRVYIVDEEEVFDRRSKNK